MGDILPEVLDRIFELCERQYRQMPHWPVFLPKSRLQPLLLVCKKWHCVAERRLYTSVSLGSDRTVKDRNGKKMVIKGKDVCRRFLETVQNNTRIASIVRELRMGSLRNLAQDGEESRMHIRLVAICKNVEKISLYGCDPSALDKMVETLANTDLLTLEFTSEQLGGYLGYEWIVPSPRTLVDLLCRWPRLQKMRVKMTGGEFDVSLPKVPVIPGFCVALKEVDARDSTFDAAQLSRLLDLSPALEDLSITVEKDCGPLLRRSIQAWSSSLKRLHVLKSPEPFPADNCYPVIQHPMPELRELDMPAPLLAVDALAYLPKLEKLSYYRGEYSQGVELARLIEKGELSRLREIHVSFLSARAIEGVNGFPTDEEKREEFELSQELRRVCGSRDINVKDSFTKFEFKVDSGGYESPDNDWD